MQRCFPQVVAESYQVFVCTWMCKLDGSDKNLPGELCGYAQYHYFNGKVISADLVFDELPNLATGFSILRGWQKEKNEKNCHTFLQMDLIQ